VRGCGASRNQEKSFGWTLLRPEPAGYGSRPGPLEAGASPRPRPAWVLERLFRDLGLRSWPFSPIVAVAPTPPCPHAEPGSTLISKECMVLVDMGARLGDYNSDQTRTFWVGDNPPDHFLRALERTQEAQAEAIKAIRPACA